MHTHAPYFSMSCIVPCSKPKSDYPRATNTHTRTFSFLYSGLAWSVTTSFSGKSASVVTVNYIFPKQGHKARQA